MPSKDTTPLSLYGNDREYLREQERTNELLADIAGEEYESPGDIPKGKYIVQKRLLDAAQKKNELLESIAEGGGGSGTGSIKGLNIDYSTDVISLKNKSGETIDGSGATLPAYGLNYNSATGGLTLTKNGTAVQGQTVSLPDYGSPLTATSTAGMTDTSKVYVNTTDGKWYYYDGSAWTAGGTYNSQGIDTDTTLLVSGAPADAKATGDAVSDLNTHIDSETTARQSADTSLQNNINTERTRAQGEEARIEALFTTPTQEAVDNWLDEHPEATTTVQDSSLTESKFTDELKLKTINDYVTPQMFGAVGNGVADDSEAIISMFANANGRKIYFPKGTYKITQDITITTNYIDIIGAGMYETTLRFNNGCGLIINGYDFSLSNLRIYDGSGVISNKYHVRFESCWFYRTNIGLTLNTAYITQCLNCYFTFNNVGVVIGTESYEVILENCVIDNNFSAGVVVKGHTIGPVIKNCTIEGNYNRTTGNGCGICLNHGYGSIIVDSCWFETNGTSEYSVDVFEVGMGYNAERLEALYNTINEIVSLNNPSNTYLYGRITITNSKFNYAKYGIATAGYNTKHVIENNVFSGQKDEYNISVLIGGRSLTENTYDFNNNIVSNSSDQSITAQMLSGINGTYIFTDLTPTGTGQQRQLSTTKFICYNYDPLFDFDPGKKTIFIDNSTKSTPLEYTFKPMGNYNTGFLYFSYDVLALFSVDAQFTALPIRAIYGTSPTVVMNSADHTITITVPAYRSATIIITQ